MQFIYFSDALRNLEYAVTIYKRDVNYSEDRPYEIRMEMTDGFFHQEKFTTKGNRDFRFNEIQKQLGLNI